MSGFHDLESEISRYDRHFRRVILPFWSEEGIDQASGLFWERFDFSGAPIRGIPNRFMVQARQVATFAQAELSGSFRAGEKALCVFDAALQQFSDDGDLSRGVAFSICGTVIDPLRDAYTHAFALYGLAAALRLSGDNRYRSSIDQILQFVDTRLVDPVHGGLEDRWPSTQAGKSQNPTMHLLEAYLLLHEAWPERGFLERAAKLVRLVEDRLMNHPHAAVLERYSVDWRPLPDIPEGSFFEPGHQFEWAWLIDRYRQLSGEQSRPLFDQLWQLATYCGFDEAGFCVDTVGLDRLPVQRSRRLWPHTEATRTALVHRSSHGDALLERMLNRLNTYFLGRPFPAGWVDRLDEHGQPALNVVPASSLYHLYGAWAQLAESRCKDDGRAALRGS